jgi:hypothetical protein
MPRSNVSDAPTAPESAVEFAEYIRRNETKYLHHFKDYEQFEYFMMLPVPESVRHLLAAKISLDMNNNESSTSTDDVAMTPTNSPAQKKRRNSDS